MRQNDVWKQKSGGKFYNAKVAKTGDVITFTSDARKVEKEFDGDLKTLVEFDIELRGEPKVYTINKTSFKAMEEAFGDTKNWIGKQASVFVAPTPKGDNKMIMLDPQVEI